MDYFKKEFVLKVSPSKEPIKFVHQKNVTSPNKHFLHLNNYVEIYIFVSGDADYVVEKHYINLEHGDIIIISPHEVHVPVIKSTCDYERFYLLIPTDIFSKTSYDPLSEILNRNSPLLSLPRDEKEEALRLLYSMSSISDTPSSTSRSMALLGLLFQLLGIISKPRENAITLISDSSKNAEIPKILSEILEYMSTSPQSIASVGDIAKHFYISQPYLSSIFKKHVGVSACNYLQIQKIAYAKKLLENGASVAYTCYECGFSDSSHFIKNFKKYVGVTPNQYKKAYMG